MTEHAHAARRGAAALDAWSIVHLASGGGLALVGVSWPWAFGLIVGFELLEAGLRQIKVEEGGLFEYESWPNVVADILLGVAGYAVAK